MATNRRTRDRNAAGPESLATNQMKLTREHDQA